MPEKCAPRKSRWIRLRELVSLQKQYANNLNQVIIHANTYGISPSEITAMQKNYADLWEPLSNLLK